MSQCNLGMMRKLFLNPMLGSQQSLTLQYQYQVWQRTKAPSPPRSAAVQGPAKQRSESNFSLFSICTKHSNFQQPSNTHSVSHLKVFLNLIPLQYGDLQKPSAPKSHTVSDLQGKEKVACSSSPKTTKWKNKNTQNTLMQHFMHTATRETSWKAKRHCCIRLPSFCEHSSWREERLLVSLWTLASGQSVTSTHFLTLHMHRQARSPQPGGHDRISYWSGSLGAPGISWSLHSASHPVTYSYLSHFCLNWRLKLSYFQEQFQCSCHSFKLSYNGWITEQDIA